MTSCATVRIVGKPRNEDSLTDCIAFETKEPLWATLAVNERPARILETTTIGAPFISLNPNLLKGDVREFFFSLTFFFLISFPAIELHFS